MWSTLWTLFIVLIIDCNGQPFEYAARTHSLLTVHLNDTKAKHMKAPSSSPQLLSPTLTGVVPPGGICSSDDECSGYPFAYCMSNCMCKDYAINAGSTCLAPGSLAQGNCGLDQVYVSEAGICMNIAKPGAPCQYSQQCSGAEVGAFCIQMRCRCVYGMTATADGNCAFINTNCTRRGMIWIAELGECKAVIAPGARSCTHRQQCTASYKDSVCFMTQCTCPTERPVAVDGTCGSSCPPGRTYSGVLNRCVSTAQPGDRCQYSSQCHAINPGTVCERGQCRCPNRFVWTGSHCAEICPSGYRENPKTGICRPGCRENQVDHEGDCLNLVPPGSPCEISAQCTGGSSCVDSLCACPYGMYNLQSACVRAKAKPGGSCAEGEECTDNSYCLEGRCVCVKGMVLYNQRCAIPNIVPPNSLCGPLIECGGGSMCINNICTCPSGHISINNQCQLPDAVQPGSTCTDADHCAGGSFCLQGICQCPTGTVIIDRRCQIPSEALPGQRCRPGLDICTGRSLCVDGICQCPPHLIQDGNVCIPQTIVPPGSKCNAQKRCGSGSTCRRGVCQCPEGMIIVEQRCELGKTAPPNYSCRNSEICTGGSYCQNGICKCPAGQVPIKEVCKLDTVHMATKCDNDNECNRGYTCISGKCTCSGMLLPSRECKVSRLAPAGSKCVPDVDICVGGSSCLDMVCKCPPGLHPDNGQCRSRKRMLYSFTCSNSTDCIGGASCQNGVCVCPEQTLLMDGQCRSLFLLTINASAAVAFGSESVEEQVLRTPEESTQLDLWSPCKPGLGQQCAGMAECIYNYCQCPDGYIAINSECHLKSSSTKHTIAIVPPGSKCSSDESCNYGSECIRGQCSCPDGYELSGIYCRKKQHPAALPGERCDRESVCTGGSICKRGRCECDSGFENIQGACIKQPISIIEAYPGDRCVQGASICMGGSTCLLGTCTCPSGTSIRNRRCEPTLLHANTALPGQPCKVSTDCLGGSTCIGSICTCPFNQVVINNECSVARITVRPGYACDANSICTGGSSCTFGICRCPKGSSVENNRCITNMAVANPGEACKDLTMVCTGGSTCKQGRCLCPPGQEISQNVCEPIWKKTANSASPGSFCRPDVTVCTGGSYCMNNICICPQGYVAKFGQCALRIRPTSVESGPVWRTVPCKSNAQCHSGSHCQEGTCICSSGNSWNADNTACVPSLLPYTVAKVPGSSCAQQINHCTGGSYCSNGYCVCPVGTVHVSHVCQSLALPGDDCWQGEVCTGRSQCNGKICVCLDGTSPYQGLCPGFAPSELAKPCPSDHDDDQCQLPHCFCSPSGLEIPGRLNAEETPQIVILTFDDPINDVNFDIYRNLFDGRYKNPNGCSIKATFFVSHEYNNYQQSQWIYWQGHEIAVNSITHETLSDMSAKEWAQQMDGMRQLLVRLSGMNASFIQGVRAPQLSGGGNAQFTMMKAYGFLYDNSMSANPGRDGAAFWPQTLDYHLAWPCEAPPCPDESYPGLWAIPINQFYGDYMSDVHQYRKGDMLRAIISKQDNAESAYRLLWNNFNRHYSSNKAPYLLTLNADFLRTIPKDGGVKAVRKFLSKVLSRTDVWVITITEAVRWIQHPTRLAGLRDFEPWQCNRHRRAATPPCQKPKMCSYASNDPEVGDRWLSSCFQCPKHYPWIKNNH